MAENFDVTFKADASLKSRIDITCSELGLDVSEVIAEAFNAYFRKLVTDGKITVEVKHIALNDSKPETEYTLTDSKPGNYTLTPQEEAGLASSQRKNYEKAKNGDPKALNVMGTYYESGNGMPKDYEKAIYWYTLAAEKGNSNAQYHLAVLYNKVEDNPLKSYYWFEVARLCGFNITAIHKDYILRLAERLSSRQLSIAIQEAQKKFAEIQKNIQ